MSSFNINKPNNGGGQKRRGNFDSVPADDGFRNYMARKIELQRKQFGLVVPPPPPSPSPPSPNPNTHTPKQPAPPKILKRSKISTTTKSIDGSSITPQSTKNINNATVPSNADDTPSPEKKSVRFHSHIEIEGKPKSMSSVLANLKQKTAGHGIIRKRSSSKLRRSSARKRRRKLQSLVDSANRNAGEDESESSNSPNESCLLGEESSPATSVLGVLDNLQKRHGVSSSSSKRRRSSSSNGSQSARKFRHDHIDNASDDDQMSSASSTSVLESLESIEEKADLFGDFTGDHSDDDNIKRSSQSKRKRESPRCKGRSILEGLDDSTIHDNEEEHVESGDSFKTTPQKSGDVALTQLTQPSPASSGTTSAKDSPSEDITCQGSESTSDLNSSADQIRDDIGENLVTDSIQQLTPSTNSVIEAPIKPARKANYRPDLFFTGVVVLVNGHTNPDATTLMRLLHKHGGDLEKYETRRVTHIIAEQLSAAKANIYKRQKNPTPVCKPEWITESVEEGRLLPFGDYLLEDVRNVDVVGTKSMKSFFGSKTDVDKNDSPEKESMLDANNQSVARAKEDHGGTGPNEGSASNEPSSPTSRWHDAHPSKANYHLNGQVRTVGNDPDFLDSYFSNSRLSYIGSFKQRVKPTKNKTSRNQSKVQAGTQKFVMLVDMDCFFAMVALRKYPQYRDKPVAVGHSHIARSNVSEFNATATKKNSSSELSTCNYIARKFGIRKGMFLGDAIQLCKDLVVLPYDFEGFEEVSGIVAEQLNGYAEQYNGCVEAVSCDESYVEINVNPSDCPGNDVHAFVNTLAECIRADIVKKTECTASIGIGPNKLLAKLAADRVKPNACCVVKDWKEFLDQRDLRDIPGVGRKVQKKLQPHGLCIVNDVWDLEGDAENVLSEIIGHGNASKIVQYCHGKDDRQVTPAVRKSIGAECNYGVRFDGPYGVDYMMAGLAKEVENRMAKAGVRGSKLVLKVMKSKDLTKVPGKFLGHGKCDSYSRTLDIPLTRDKDVMTAAGMKLFDRLGIDKELVRGMGIVINSLKHDDENGSLDSSPSRLSSWLKNNSSLPLSSKDAVAKVDDNEVTILEEQNDFRGARVTFAIEENKDANKSSTSSTNENQSSIPTFSQLDQDVLKHLPEDILSEVKSMYGKSSSQQSQSSTQSRMASPRKKPAAKKANYEKQIPIAGQTSVRRMLKLACVKSGEDQLGSAVTLSQLDSLPLEVQLQIANGDNITIAKDHKHKTKSTYISSRSISLDQENDSDVEVLSVQKPDAEEQDGNGESREEPLVKFYQDNIAPLQEFIIANPDPDAETVESVKDFLLMCIAEKRIDDTVKCLRSIKNMKGGWGKPIYSQLIETAIQQIHSTTGNVLDMRWLGL